MNNKKGLFKIGIFFNILLLILQLVAMDSLNFGLLIPVLSLTTPLLCLINLLFFTYWLFRFKWPFLLFLVFFAISFDSWQLLYQFKPKGIPTSKGLNIMSYNVRSFNRFEWLDIKDVPNSIANFINQKNPDVICFQEFLSDNAPPLEKYPYKVFKPYLPNGKIGSCIISRYPLLNSKSISFKDSFNGGMQSDLIWQRDTLRLYNLHFESLRINSKDTIFGNKLSFNFNSKIKRVFKLQKKQIKDFMLLTRENKFPEIICTDLNNNAFSENYKALASGRSDAFKEKGSGFGSTYQFPFFPLRIDFIFTASNIKVVEFETHDVRFSDHNPISAIIQWP